MERGGGGGSEMIAERRRNVKAVTARSKNGRGAGGAVSPMANAATHSDRECRHTLSCRQYEWQRRYQQLVSLEPTNHPRGGTLGAKIALNQNGLSQDGPPGKKTLRRKYPFLFVRITQFGPRRSPGPPQKCAAHRKDPIPLSLVQIPCNRTMFRAVFRFRN